MKHCLFLLSIFFIAITGCSKNDSFSTDPVSKLEFSADSLLFDTVFTGVGSVTQRIKIFNRHSKALKIESIKLGNGSVSNFQININGTASNQLTNFELRAKDSINLFVKVTIDPNSDQTPYLVKDSIVFLTNGNHQKVTLEAYGQNAHFLKDVVLTDHTVWGGKIPYVIYNSVKINPEKALLIKKGARVLFHKDAQMIVAGTLRVEGEVKDSVIFASDRLERIYAEEAGQWKGIHFLSSSKDNVVNYAFIKNAVIGIQVDSLSRTPNPKLLLANTIIKNMELFGLHCLNAEVKAFNNLITNCGKHLLYAVNGGFYNFKQNTFFNSNLSFPRNTPSINFANESTTQSSLHIDLVNNIFWGNLQEEFVIQRSAIQSYTENIKSNILKTRNIALDHSNILNTDPLFKNTRNYNFILLPRSPAVNKGQDLSSDASFSQWLSKDMRGHERLFPSEIGSYELL